MLGCLPTPVQIPARQAWRHDVKRVLVALLLHLRRSWLRSIKSFEAGYRGILWDADSRGLNDLRGSGDTIVDQDF